MIGTGSYISDIEQNLAHLENTSYIALGISLVLLLFVSALLVRSVLHPLKALVERMKSMREDDLASDVPHVAARSELGSMARSIDVFREQLVERKRLEQEQAEKDAELAREREAALQHKLETEAQQAREAEQRHEEEERQRAEREEIRAGPRRSANATGPNRPTSFPRSPRR